MLPPQILSLEDYSCPDCDIDIISPSDEQKEEIEENEWRCPECDKPLLIHGRSQNGEIDVLIQRKRAEELQLVDMLYPERLKAPPSSIISIDEKRDGTLRIAIKEFRVVTATKDQIFDCKF